MTRVAGTESVVFSHYGGVDVGHGDERFESCQSFCKDFNAAAALLVCESG